MLRPEAGGRGRGTVDEGPFLWGAASLLVLG